MKYSDDIGLIYDIVYFNLIYFNEERIKNRCSVYNSFTDSDFDFYKALKKKNNVIPPEYLYAFFYYDPDRDCFLKWYLINHLPSDRNFIDFLDVINNKTLLLQNFLEYFLGKVIDIKNGNEIYNNSINIDFSNDVKISIFTILIDFDRSINDIVNIINTQKHIIYIKRLQMNKTNEIHKSLNSKEFQNLYKHSSEKSCFSICHMFPYFYLFKEHKLTYFCVGEKFLISVNHAYMYKDVTLESYSYVRSNPTRNAIINILAGKELTSSQIIDELNKINEFITDDMAFKALHVLVKENAIKKSKKIKRKLLYTLSLDYFNVIYNLEKMQKDLIMGGSNE